MHLFGWKKGTQASDERPPAKPPGGASPRRVLIRELLWHVEERDRLARELEREYTLARGALGFRHVSKYPELRGTLIPTAELQQLECLCGQIPAVHAAAVLFRFREVLATNNILPWELVSVFKQVLCDFLNMEECENLRPSAKPVRLQPMEAWTCTNIYQMKQGFAVPNVHSRDVHSREEIPTISGYIDRATRCPSWFTTQGPWDLPYYCPVPPRDWADSLRGDESHIWR